MGREHYVIEAIFREGRSHRDVAVAAGVSKAWVTKLVGRYRVGGELQLHRLCSHQLMPNLPLAGTSSDLRAIEFTASSDSAFLLPAIG
jgi:hypothetical protein